MAVDYNRQYIGARYVPQFFKNPNGSWDWARGFQYEPLTIVRYGENSYTSKQLVPSTVGAPNENPSYWAQTGNYNGIVNNIQEEINTMKEKVNLNKTKFLFIGDSYGIGVVAGSPSVPTTGWCNPLKNFIEANGGTAVWNITGGEGFTNGKYEAQLDMANGNFDEILVCGCFNDLSLDENDTTIESFMTKAKIKFPFARIRVANVAIGSWEWYPKIMKVRPIMKEKVIQNGGEWVENGYLFMHRKSYLQPDTIHPNQAGINQLVKCLKDVLTGGNGSVKYSKDNNHIIDSLAICLKLGVYEISNLPGNTWTNFDDSFPDFMLYPSNGFYTNILIRVTKQDDSTELSTANLTILNNNWALYPQTGFINIKKISLPGYNPILFDLNEC